MRPYRISQIRPAPIIDFLSTINYSNDVISFGQGIPFFPPPESTIQEIKEALHAPLSYKYSSDLGFSTLRQLIAKKILQEQKTSIDPNCQVMVTSGANQAFMNTIIAITDPGDEIIFFTPTYFNYVMAVKMVGCKPILIKTDKTFQPDVSHLSENISAKTKAIVSISPNNPTGAVYPADTLNKINQLCMDNSLYHISDEVYEYFHYDGSTHHSPLSFDNSLSHTISLFSLSKSFALSGYRIGYMVFPKDLYKDILKVQDTVGICAPSLSQIAAMTAIPLGNSHVIKNYDILLKNRELVNTMLAEVKGINLVFTKGAYYFFITINSSISSFQLAKELAEKYKVIVLPGALFDYDQCSFRLSYGNVYGKQLKEGLNRLSKGLKNIIS